MCNRAKNNYKGFLLVTFLNIIRFCDAHGASPDIDLGPEGAIILSGIITYWTSFDEVHEKFRRSDEDFKNEFCKLLEFDHR